MSMGEQDDVAAKLEVCSDTSKRTAAFMSSLQRNIYVPDIRKSSPVFFVQLKRTSECSFPERIIRFAGWDFHTNNNWGSEARIGTDTYWIFVRFWRFPNLFG